jgi:CRISPR/Cas system CSM-associated protein Csm3 (group 7 of RAMP superfamily)
MSGVKTKQDVSNSYEYYKVTVENLEPLRVGAPENPISGEHLTVARLGSTVVIPGPTLKGAMRDSIERFLIHQFYQGNQWRPGAEAFKPCIPADQPSVDENHLISVHKYRGRNCRYTTPKKKNEPRKISPICPVCYLLGAMGLEGFVRMPFLKTEVPAQQLYSCRIDRATKTVAGQTNRSYELVPPNNQFVGTLEVMLQNELMGWQLGSPRKLGHESLGDKWLEGQDPPPKQDIINQYIVGRLEAITFLGSYKSKGFGRVKIKVEKTSLPK